MSKKFMRKLSKGGVTDLTALKALGIVLVLIGHAPGLGSLVYKVIYAFHMPLFFFISGYYLSDKRLGNNTIDFLKDVGVKLFIPYLIFYLISYVYMWLRAEYMGVDQVPFFLPLLVSNSEILASINVTLWFFPALILARIIYFYLYRYCPNDFVVLIVTLILFLILFFCGWASLPWCLELSLLASFYLSVGRLFQYIKPMSFFSGIPLVVVGFLAVLVFEPKSDFRSLNFSMGLVFFVPVSLAFLSGLFFIFSGAFKNKAIEFLADNSLIIFPTHILVYSALTGGVEILDFDDLVVAGWLLGCSYLVVTLLLSPFIVRTFRYVLPRY
ncbi:acyltransferase family protein [Aestuariicella sp. G3-2]|uniref:acyltransferase family protein n=1 Tax=Pseudomaricurvus albidus TaxID=2842452 RepID=UPI001C0CA646|nr:acyltransferase family protein [Aestuariicella albida]MBU3071535.1 acyltransferase family protein [Aestuariicella albida]